ncbi:MAG: M50 family metallopeptidase [Firmicutes bacterium]|nr:site-2 protease family protein [Alicyclobacillaceae bacterium]MCL6496809.1 M50 family metallopeptidase [Bacillota bacterium]
MATVVAWVLVFGVLIAVHEFGHFAVAKWLDMRVEEFALGFGPALWSARRGETLYAVRAVPLGGYVRLAGMEGPGEGDRDDPRQFPNRPLWQRFCVIGAGPVMNLVLAAVLYAVVFGGLGLPEPTTVVARTLPQYPAYAAGIRPGDRIVAVAGEPVHSWSAIQRAIAAHPRQPFTVTVERHGQQLVVTVHTRYDPAQRAAIIGIQPTVATVRLSPLAALGAGVQHTGELTRLWFVTLAQLVTGRGRFDVAGPVGIAVMVGQAAQAGLTQLLLLAAALSANLGLFNILPVPVLDGSRLFLLGLEGVRRRALDPARESLIHLVGMVVLLLFVAVVTYHDITSLLVRGRAF